MPVKKNADPAEVTRNVAPSEVSKPEVPEKKEEVNTEPQSYVHLADGTVLRCNDADLPIGGGSGTPHGHWQKGNKAYQVIGVYPVESVVEES